MKTLVAGWFSFEQMGATAGDFLARDVALEWLKEAGRECDVALAPPFQNGVDWQVVDPCDYAEVVFVCGPFGNGWPVTGFLERFAGRRIIGLNLSMLQPLEVWNPFDLLLERDSTRVSHPELALLSNQPPVPVVGIVLVHRQLEYKDGLHAAVKDAIDRLVASRPMAAVPIDSRLDVNGTGLRSPAEVESLIARMDALITTRLHGAVLALKNGVPALAIDPIAGGAKIATQMRTIGWPLCFTPEQLDDAKLRDGLAYCLTGEARSKARECVGFAKERLGAVHEQFMSAMSAAVRG